MAAGMALSVAQTLFAALQCSELRELSTIFNYQSKLEDLERTVEMIKAVLLDADFKRQELTEAGRNWVEKLKDAVYDADDLFDELITRAKQKEMSKGKISKKVRRFFSNENQLLFGFNKSREIKKIREKLDAIADDRVKFGISNEYKPVKRREETCSYVYETNVIGREAEKEEIVDMLLSEATSSVSFVSIVGMGGLGKTTFAQLVFNDKRIEDTFGCEMYWVCVSEEFGLFEIFCKLLGWKNSQCTLEVVQKEVRRKIEGKKYLLVLDDVWEESNHEWLKLKEYLSSGGFGSRILVTTRSKKVAKAADKDVVVYELKGLSEEYSRQLFREIAFRPEDYHNTHLVEIANDIVEKCGNVPLSIRVTASLLYDMDRSKWEEYRSGDLVNMSPHGEKDPIMSTLMFSYYNLTPELKSCFSFCSLFPKDYIIRKELLISLWLAEGYLVPRCVDESMEKIGEEYFWILLQRCFFQDVQKDPYYDEIVSCKMHDLMHDLAFKVAGNESLMLTSSITNDMKKQLRHLSFTSYPQTNALYSKDCPSRKSLRTFLKLTGPRMDVNGVTLVPDFIRLRVLYLEGIDMELLPDEVGKLLHLRYLDVSWNSCLQRLPESITNLHNLQVLDLTECSHLRELPTNIGKLVNLRRLLLSGCSGLKKLPKDIGNLVNLQELDISECSTLEELPENIIELVNLRTFILFREDRVVSCDLKYMPAGMNKLRKLCNLTGFVVGGDSLTHVQKAELADLKGLTCLRGFLWIIIRKCSPSNTPIAAKETNILKNAHLKALYIMFDYRVSELDQEGHETMLEGLHPNNYHLRELSLRGYHGMKFPNWGSGTVRFPTQIVRMELTICVRLKYLSSMSKLVHLKYLTLSRMTNLEYIEEDAPCETLFFPSLEELSLEYAQNLKGWWRDITMMVEETGQVLPSFPRLLELTIINCKRLKYFPPCPHLKVLELRRRVNKELSFCTKRSSYYSAYQTNPSTSSSSFDLSSIRHPTFFCLDKLIIVGTEETLNSIFSESFGSIRILVVFRCASQSLSEVGGGIKYLTNLKSLEIGSCKNLESLGEDDDEDGMQWKSFGSLSSLKLIYLPKLVNLAKDFQYLTSLRSFTLDQCDNLEMKGLQWKFLQSLSSLELINLPQLVNLPKGIQHLTSLQHLRIEDCKNLEGLGEIVGSLTSLQSLIMNNCSKVKSIPDAMRHLTSLTQLQIGCISEELQKRCQERDGEDWHNICHIPNFKFSRERIVYKQIYI